MRGNLVADSKMRIAGQSSAILNQGDSIAVVHDENPAKRALSLPYRPAQTGSKRAHFPALDRAQGMGARWALRLLNRPVFSIWRGAYLEDAGYVALAHRGHVPLVTADEALVRQMTKSPYRVISMGDLRGA
ncbi:MAG: hypothetical protein HZB53_01320 [Chloroflexi bacterium]|nr:hypothetical protein [Chloroflexota bacterium]